MRQHCVIALTVALLAAGPAAADPLMDIKAGEWVGTMSMGDGVPGRQVKSCAPADRTMTDEALDKMLNTLPGAKCNFSHSKSGNVVNIQSSCDVQGMHMNTTMAMTIMNENDYTIASKTVIQHGPQGMPPEMSMNMHWTRTGPCQPGDRMMPAQP